MTIKIEQKIKGYQVVKPDDKAAVAAPAPVAAAPALEIIDETLDRPEFLSGATYKIKSPLVEHALYVTINDVILNQGTEHEQRRPFEVFINSKNMDQFQWIVALTRVISAVFRKGGDVVFLVHELKAVFDPHGGYFKPGGVYVPSLIAEIGGVIERHLQTIGVMERPQLDAGAQQLIADKRAAFEAREKGGSARSAPSTTPSTAASAEPAAEFPATATLCKVCHVKAEIVMDGCATCLNCGASKCG